MHPKMDAIPKTPPVDIYGGAPKNGCNSKTPPAVIYIATSGHGHKSHTTRMEHPAQNAGVDQVLKCAQDNMAAFKMAVDTEDVATLRSMLREMNPQYNAACKQYGIPKAPSAKSRQQKDAAALEAKACEVAAGMDVDMLMRTEMGYISEGESMIMLLGRVAAEDTKKGKTDVQEEEKTRQQKAAAALEAKACEVAAGMDVRVDENGQLVTTVNATKAMSDEEMERLGLWLPPVGFDECNGDIFYNKHREKDVSDYFSVFSLVDKKFEPNVKKLFGVKGAGTSSTDNYKQCKQTDMVGAATGHVSEFSDKQYDEQYVSNNETSVKALVGIVHPPRTNRFVQKMPLKYPASMQDGGMWMEVKRWNPV